jgi:hypothetical protein
MDAVTPVCVEQISAEEFSETGRVFRHPGRALTVVTESPLGAGLPRQGSRHGCLDRI